MTATTSTPALGVIMVCGKLDKLRELPLAPEHHRGAERVSGARATGRPHARRSARAVRRLAGTRRRAQLRRETFSLLRDRAGFEPRFGRRPTVHGLRHTFAIRTMLDAYQHRPDAGARLGIL